MSDLAARQVPGGVTAPQGFRAAGISCGIKARGLDLALLASAPRASAAAIFTTNRAQAAPVIVSRRQLTASSGHAAAIVANSGCANACTGADGMRDAEAMAARVAAVLPCAAADVLVASTGVIGVKLPMEKLDRGIRTAAAALS